VLIPQIKKIKILLADLSDYSCKEISTLIETLKMITQENKIVKLQFFNW